MEIYWFLSLTAVVVATLIVPLMIDLLKFAVPHWRLSRVTGRAAHFILFIMFGGLVIIINRYHFFIYMPLLLENKGLFYCIKGWAHFIFSIWLWVNILGNYCYTVTVHPGIDSTYKSRRVFFEKEKLAAYGLDIFSQGPVVKKSIPKKNLDVDSISRPIPCSIPKKHANCQKSMKMKPQNGLELEPSRSGFCSVCRCAISYWDHHCPFTGNCIGLRNYSNFFIGLCYGLIGGLYAVVISWHFFYNCNILPVVSKNPYEHDLDGQCEEIGANSYIFIPTFLLFWMTMCIVALHVIFLLADLSTQDVLNNWDKYQVNWFVMQRLLGMKFLDSESRMQTLMVRRKNAFLSLLLPIRNTELVINS